MNEETGSKRYKNIRNNYFTFDRVRIRANHKNAQNSFNYLNVGKLM